MKATKLLVSVALAMAIVAPIAGFLGDMNVAQPITSTQIQLIRQSKPIADRQVEIEFLDPGVEVFAFTFG